MSGDSAEWVLKTLSPARMTPYLAQTAGDVGAASAQWNLSVCAAFYSPLHWLEVALRNAMHETLRDHFDANAGGKWRLSITTDKRRCGRLKPSSRSDSTCETAPRQRMTSWPR